MRRLAVRSHTLASGPGRAVFIGFLTIACSMRTAHADSYAYAAGLFGEYSDNIRRTSADTQTEWVDSVIAGGTYHGQGPVLDAHLLAQVEYRDYRKDSYEDGPFYYADASALWRIAPQRLHWVFADRYSQITRDVARPDTPDNRIDTNVLNTGPDLYIRLGQANTLVFGLRYENTSYGEGDLDSYRYAASARWQYAASRETAYSLNYEAGQVWYDNEVVNENNVRQDVFVRIDRHHNRDRFLLDLGATRLDRDRSGEALGSLTRLTWTQQLTSISSAGVFLAAEYLDAGTVLLSSATGSVPGAGTPSSSFAAGGITNDFFYTKRIEGYYHRNDNNYGLDARGYYRDIDYEISQQDRRENGGRLEASYNLFGALTTAVYGSAVGIEFLSNGRDDLEYEAGIRFQYRINRSFNTSLDGRRTWRYSTDASQEYTDHRILISLAYSSSPLYALRTELTGGRAARSFQAQETPLVANVGYPVPVSEQPGNGTR